MQKFLELEGAYITIGLVIALIALFVSTRKLMPKGAYKKGVGYTLIIISLLIGLDFYMRINRMNEIKAAFNAGRTILCESRMLRKAAQSVSIQKSSGWSLENDLFSSPQYSRSFHSARCIVKPSMPNINR